VRRRRDAPRVADLHGDGVAPIGKPVVLRASRSTVTRRPQADVSGVAVEEKTVRLRLVTVYETFACCTSLTALSHWRRPAPRWRHSECRDSDQPPVTETNSGRKCQGARVLRLSTGVKSGWRSGEGKRPGRCGLREAQLDLRGLPGFSVTDVWLKFAVTLEAGPALLNVIAR